MGGLLIVNCIYARVYINISFHQVFYLIGQAHCQGLTLEITLCRKWLLLGN